MALTPRSRRRSSHARTGPAVRQVERLWQRLANLFGSQARATQAPSVVLAPRRLESRRLLDAGAAGLALQLLDAGDFVQAGQDFASLADTAEEPRAVIPNTPPSNLEIAPIAAIDEDGLATLELAFDDPDAGDAHLVQINWGDGSPLETFTLAAGTKTLETTHHYVDDPAGIAVSNYKINVQVADATGGVASATANAAVRNVAPTITDITPVATIDENQIATLEFDFTDPGTLDVHQVEIDWGDGSPTQILSVAAGARTFSATHKYVDDNAADLYTIAFRVLDDDGDIDSASTTVVVKNVAPSITDITPVATIDENQVATLEFDFADPGALDVHQVEVDWGDGSPTQILSVAAGARTFSATHRYLDDNAADKYTIAFRVLDDDGDIDSASTTVVVKNVAPTITDVTPVAMIDENQVATLEFDFADPGTLDVHQVEIDWGDGSPTQILPVAAGARTFSATHKYLDDNAADLYTIAFRVLDDDGDVDSATTTVTVKNVTPAITNLPPVATINENQVATLSLQFNDPGVLDKHEIEIDWGDGSAVETLTLSAGVRVFSTIHQYPDDDPSVTSSDPYTITVRVRDDDGGVSAVRTATVTVKNVAPTITTIAPVAMINENQFATLQLEFADPGTRDTHQVEVDWGDGSAVETLTVSAGARNFSTTHQYLDDNDADLYTITVRVRDDDGGVSPAQTATVTVKNVAPLNVAVIPSAAPIVEGAPATFRFEFDDPGTLDTHTYVIDWGDGSTSTGTAPGRGFLATHTYADNGSYTVRATFTDDDGGVGTGMTTISVGNVRPTIVDIADDQTIDEGSLLTLAEIARFTDRGFDNPLNPGGATAESFTYTIDWGDTKSTPATPAPHTDGSVGTPSSGTFGGSHTYADNGTYTVTVTVRDDDGGETSRTFTVTVNNVDPMLRFLGPPLVTNEGSEISLETLVGVQDPGFDNAANQSHPTNGGEFEETFTAVSVNWGDGKPTESLEIAARVPGSAGVPTTATFQHTTHTYADNGVYTVSIVLRDDDGANVTRTFQITVNNVAPSLTATIDKTSIKEGESIRLDGLFTDPGFNNPDNILDPSNGGETTETFDYVIDWGDGSMDTIVDVDPSAVSDGAPGRLTSSTFTHTHQFKDNDLDNLYTITITVTDDDGDSVTKTFVVEVLNVPPTLVSISATDVNSEGNTTLTLTFNDPGADTLDVYVDWGDGNLAFEKAYAGPIDGTFTIPHHYEGPPRPENPADDIHIFVEVRDDDFATGTREDDPSVTLEAVITNPGTGNKFVRIDTSPKVPMLAFPVRTVNAVVVTAAQQAAEGDDDGEMEGSAGQAAVSSERYLELVLINPDGSIGGRAELSPEALNNLPALFRNLPDGHYEIYLVQAETDIRRLVMEVYVRDGRLIDPSDDSEGARDRPPSDEASGAEAEDAKAGEVNRDVDETPTSSGAPNATGPADADGADAVRLPDPVLPLGEARTRWPSATALRHGSTLASVALALSAAGRSWRDQVDQSLAKAKSEQRKKLKLAGHWRGTRKPR